MSRPITEAIAVLLTLCVMGGYYAAASRFRVRANGLLGSGVVPALVILGIAALVPSSHLPSDRLEHADAELRLGTPERAEEGLRAWLRDHPDDLEVHRLYVYAHFQRAPSRAEGQHPSDEEMRAYYERGASHGLTPATSHYGLSLYWFYRRDYARSLAEIDSISDRVPLVWLDRGRTLARLGRSPEAYDSFARAAEDPSARSRSLAEMSVALAQSERWDDLQRMVSDPERGQATESYARRALYLHAGQWFAYAQELLRTFYLKAPLPVLLLAGLGLVGWWLVVRWWDQFDTEPLGLSMCVVALGAVLSHLVFALHDVLSVVWGMQLGGSGMQDLLYCIFWIGMPEELAKAIPVLLVCAFTAEIDEPVDWMIFATLSALGFSTWENVSYFERLGTGVVLGRTLLAMPFHLATSALLLAVVPESRRRGFRLWYSVPLAWIALGTIHGCFDYCLVAPFEWLRVVAVLVALLTQWGFHEVLQNALVLSPFRQEMGELTRSVAGWAAKGTFTLALSIFAANVVVVGYGPGLSRLFLMVGEDGFFTVMALASCTMLLIPGRGNGEVRRRSFARAVIRR